MELINLSGQLINNGDYGPRQRTDAIVIHHTADYERWDYSGVQAVKDIARYHVTALGWAGVGYNIIMARDSDGRVKAYQTRPLDNQGAHTYGRNEVSIGISMANNFSGNIPTDEWYQITAEVAAFVKKTYPNAQLLGHREYALPGWATACPGSNFNLDKWRSLVDGLANEVVNESEVELIPETQHYIAYGFRRYWYNNGGVNRFGWPISEEFKEVSAEDGVERTVQYFERARLEYHPDLKGTPYETQLGLVGTEAYNARYNKQP